MGFVKENNLNAVSVESLEKLLNSPLVGKSFPLNYYSEEIVFSSKARLEWVEPDKTKPYGAFYEDLLI